ncbi:uncharacterized protein L201_004368 [Kwoniella dendrophila CBS 6074]|uniref:F-box domain-containing protein n=1 Tax=Kwoniella dendrophila CBS 6074 TaxID=1295534 RepID=A0AAX4JW30_9TREE
MVQDQDLFPDFTFPCSKRRIKQEANTEIKQKEDFLHTPVKSKSFRGKKIADLIVSSITDKSTLAKLMRVSSLFHEIVPIHLYEEIRLTKNSSYKLLGDPSQPIESLLKKLAYCEKIKSITFLELPSSRFYFHANKLAEGVSELGLDSSSSTTTTTSSNKNKITIFPKVNKLIFSSETVIELSLYREKFGLTHDFLEILSNLTQPRQLCITYPHFTASDCADYISAELETKKTHNPPARLRLAEEAVNSFNLFRDKNIPEEVRKIIAIFNSSKSQTLYKLFLHQVGSNTQLPACIPISNFYFRSCSCGCDKATDQPKEEDEYQYSLGMNVGCFSHTSLSSRLEQLSLLPGDVKIEREYRMEKGMRQVKQKIKLINPLLWRNNTQKQRESYKTKLKERENNWDSEQIELLSWKEAEICPCCYTKEGL